MRSSRREARSRRGRYSCCAPGFGRHGNTMARATPPRIPSRDQRKRRRKGSLKLNGDGTILALKHAMDDQRMIGRAHFAMLNSAWTPYAITDRLIGMPCSACSCACTTYSFQYERELGGRRRHADLPFRRGRDRPAGDPGCRAYRRVGANSPEHPLITESDVESDQLCGLYWHPLREGRAVRCPPSLGGLLGY